ncbi:MAG TPA: hypothetical protein VMH04_01980 [Candidatus Solibacter sp.]|nr:hypothetical protein [Candidatus Solibacter sp.]
MKAMFLLLLALCLFSAEARSQSPFDGTWIIDTGKNENLASEKPRVLSVAEGVFREGDTQLKTDGSDQKVPATGYWDTVSVRIVDDHTVEVISKKAGRPMFTETDTVSADGNTLTQVMKDTTESEAVTFESDFRRVAPGPAGAHVVSGSWQVFKQSRSENSTIIKYKCTSQGFSAETPLGEKLEAKFDGKLYEMEDDPGHTMVSVKLINPYTVEQTNVRDGKVVFIVTLEVTPDGTAIHATSKSKDGGSVKTWTLHKQSK